MSRAAMMFAILVIILSGCQSKEINVKYTLSDEQLSLLMFDIQLSEVAIGELTGSSRDSLSELFWKRLSEVYKLSKPELVEEIRRLETDPEKMKVIMDRVQVLADSIR